MHDQGGLARGGGDGLDERRLVRGHADVFEVVALRLVLLVAAGIDDADVGLPGSSDGFGDPGIFVVGLLKAQRRRVRGGLADDELLRASHLEPDGVRDAGFHGYLNASFQQNVVEDELLDADLPLEPGHDALVVDEKIKVSRASGG